jgi:hypothetical protein
MPIHLLLQNHAFGPEAIAMMVTAFEDALRELQLVDRADPAVEIVAKKTIELAQRGERDPKRLCEQVLRCFALPENAPITGVKKKPLRQGRAEVRLSTPGGTPPNLPPNMSELGRHGGKQLIETTLTELYFAERISASERVKPFGGKRCRP